MPHSGFQALLLRSMKQIGDGNVKGKGRWWFWLQESYLDQSSEDCQGCNGTSLHQLHLVWVCSFRKLFPFVQVCKFSADNKQEPTLLLNKSSCLSCRLACAIRSTVCLCERWSDRNLLSPVRHSEADRQGLPAAVLISKTVRQLFLSQRLRTCCGVQFADVINEVPSMWFGCTCRDVWLAPTQQQHFHQNATICIYSTFYHLVLELCQSINQQINGYDTSNVP